jgi:hypothetical protein
MNYNVSMKGTTKCAKNTNVIEIETHFCIFGVFRG